MGGFHPKVGHVEGVRVGVSFLGAHTRAGACVVERARAGTAVQRRIEKRAYVVMQLWPI